MLTGDSHLAQDVVQECLLRAQQRSDAHLHIEHTEEGKGRLRDAIVNAVPADRVTINGAPAVVTDALEENASEVKDAKVVFQPDGGSYAFVLGRRLT